MADELQISHDFSLAYFSGDRKTGTISLISNENGRITIKHLKTGPETGLEKMLKPVFVGLTEDQRVILLDPKAKRLDMSAVFPADAFPAHIYSDPYSNCDWFMNDGDKDTGNDTLNCGNQGSSVSAIENTASSTAKFLGTICVGRGHHQACFTAPSSTAPQVPRRAVISNLQDGTLSVIGNDPGDAATYLKVIATINLAEADKEEGGSSGVPNKAFPHGLAYSPYTGKVYNLNNGYGTVAVIDPISNEIEKRIDFKGHSNLFMIPGGRFIIGRGADRKSDPAHIFGKLSVLDLSTLTVTDSCNLQDIYFSKYYLNFEGTRLYLTTSSSGSPQQAGYIRPDVVLVIDLTALPKIKVLKEIKLGASSGSLALLVSDSRTRLVFSSNSEAGSVTVIDAETETVIGDIPVTTATSHSRVWVL